MYLRTKSLLYNVDNDKNLSARPDEPNRCPIHSYKKYTTHRLDSHGRQSSVSRLDTKSTKYCRIKTVDLEYIRYSKQHTVSHAAMIQPKEAPLLLIDKKL